MSTSSAHTPLFVLQARDLSGGPAGLSIIQHLNVNWPPGVSWICGGEGSGKTTLLQLLAGDMSPTTGSVTVPSGGVFWADLQATPHDTTTVQACWDTLRTRYPNWSDALQNELAQALDMHTHRHKRLNMLSTGSRRKVMVIAALASGATVTLLDQPFGGLDLASIRVIKDFLREAATQTHRAWLVADYEAPRDVPLASVLNLDSAL
jgi:ABC-type multidrug transport system ATPase subunit